MQFFWHEYRLNHFIHHFGKPYISLIDGMVMGGGLVFHCMEVILSPAIVLFLRCQKPVLAFFPILGQVIY